MTPCDSQHDVTGGCATSPVGAATTEVPATDASDMRFVPAPRTASGRWSAETAQAGRSVDRRLMRRPTVAEPGQRYAPRRSNSAGCGIHAERQRVSVLLRPAATYACAFSPAGACQSPGRDLYLLCLIPAVYFTCLHVVFVSSIRYRQPAMLPLIVLAAGVLAQWIGRPAPDAAERHGGRSLQNS
jgi:hypothetical protein